MNEHVTNASMSLRNKHMGTRSVFEQETDHNYQIDWVTVIIRLFYK
jgi:hypothetical protein